MSSPIPMLPAGPAPHAEPETWQPAFTAREAKRFHISRRRYKQFFLWARMVVDHHQPLGTPRQLWEGTANHNDQFVGPYIEDGELELAVRLERHIDPNLDEAHGLLEDTKAGLDAAARHPRPVTTPESGANYTGSQAVELVAVHDRKIEADFHASRQHHRRVPPRVAAIGKVLPWLEALGLLGFVAYFLNVPLLSPWEDWLGFTLGVTIVVVLIYSQTRLVHGGGEKHNAAREAAADGNWREAQRAYHRRNLFVAAGALTAAAITAGLILRGIAVLGDTGPILVALLVFLAILTGLLMPVVSYLSVALDGSKVSRERDSVAADLDDDLETLLETTEDCRRNIAGIAEIRDTLNTKNFPDICNAVQETVDGAYTPYNTARVLIGGLTADPPSKTTRTVEQPGADGRVTGQIGTGIPGTRTVNLGPLFDRAGRLAELDRQRTGLDQRLAGLPQHPWAKIHTS
jgi:hypothetical protein